MNRTFSYLIIERSRDREIGFHVNTYGDLRCDKIDELRERSGIKNETAGHLRFPGNLYWCIEIYCSLYCGVLLCKSLNLANNVEINYTDKLDEELRCEQLVLNSLEKSAVSLVVYENDEVDW